MYQGKIQLWVFETGIGQESETHLCSSAPAIKNIQSFSRQVQLLASNYYHFICLEKDNWKLTAQSTNPRYTCTAAEGYLKCNTDPFLQQQLLECHQREPHILHELCSDKKLFKDTRQISESIKAML